MESQTFSSIENQLQHGSLSLTAAMVVLGLSSIASLSPSRDIWVYEKPTYSIAAIDLSSGGFMNIGTNNKKTQSSIESNTVPFGNRTFSDIESFATPLTQGLQFIQQIAFIGVDNETDKAIDAYFATRKGRMNKLFVNPYKKQA